MFAGVQVRATEEEVTPEDGPGPADYPPSGCELKDTAEELRSLIGRVAVGRGKHRAPAGQEDVENRGSGSHVGRDPRQQGVNFHVNSYIEDILLQVLDLLLALTTVSHLWVEETELIGSVAVRKGTEGDCEEGGGELHASDRVLLYRSSLCCKQHLG